LSNDRLLQEPDGERILVVLAVAGFDRGHDHVNNPENDDNGQDKEADAKPAEGEGDRAVNGVADLEVEHFFANAVEVGAFGTLDEPDHERREDLPERGHEKPGEAAQMQRDGPALIFARGNRRRCGGCRRRQRGFRWLVGWRRNRRRRVFHGCWMNFARQSVNRNGGR